MKADREAEKRNGQSKRLEAEAAAQEAAESSPKAAEAAGDVQVTDADGEVGRFCSGCGAPWQKDKNSAALAESLPMM